MKRYLKINSDRIIDISKISTIYIKSDNCLHIVIDKIHYRFAYFELVFKDERCAKEYDKEYDTILDNNDKRNHMRNAMLEIMYYCILYNTENVQDNQYCEEEIRRYINAIKSKDDDHTSSYNPFKFTFLEDYINAKSK